MTRTGTGRRASGSLWLVSLLVGTLALIFALWVKPWAWTRQSLAPQRTGIVTVSQITRGSRDRYGRGSFAYKGQLKDGRNVEFTAPEAFGSGSRLRVLYRIGSRGTMVVDAYELCVDPCGQ